MSVARKNFDFSATSEGVVLSPLQPKAGIFARLTGKPTTQSLEALSREDWDIATAIADIRTLAEDDEAAFDVTDETLSLPHDLVARLDSKTAAILDLPSLVDLTLETSTEGMIGSPTFRLHCRWTQNGRLAAPKRTGAILHTDRGDRRLPENILLALSIAESFDPAAPLADHWASLASFRQALAPEETDELDAIPSDGARVRMMEFLANLKIRTADAFSLSIRETTTGPSFDPTPFSRKNIQDTAEPDETGARLDGDELETFHTEVRRRGAARAYKIGDNTYLSVDKSAAPALKVIASKQRSSSNERADFIANPRPHIADAYEEALRDHSDLTDSTDLEIEEAVEASVGSVFVETREYLSARVTGVGEWRPPELTLGETRTTTWLPEIFSDGVREKLDTMPVSDLETLLTTARAAQAIGDTAIPFQDEELPVHNASIADLQYRVEEAQSAIIAEEDQILIEPDSQSPEITEDSGIGGPVVLETAENFETLAWLPKSGPRETTLPQTVTTSISTTLMDHQKSSFDWCVDAWRAGLPGVLNADEQGLGKTLQTISFLAWLREHMAAADPKKRAPILVVAPTSLLENWEAEVDTHMNGDGLGHLIRLYGGSLSSRKRRGAKGVETNDGSLRLDFDALEEAIEEGRGHRYWLLTTYRTLTDYQHSFARLKFSAVVFDEIQNIKNPATLNAAAARSVAADFRLGLTGTPVENRTGDIWAIMDQIAPGALGTLATFNADFGRPNPENMRQLHRLIFDPQKELPALGIRRLKAEVAPNLAPKQRLLHPRLMDEFQATRYLEARAALNGSSRGGALKALQHIRSVSMHPGDDTTLDGEASFVSASARVEATLEILQWIQKRGERALVFIEHRKLQHRFVELAKRTFGLNDVPIINGNTPVKKRLPIVKRFQRHLEHDEGFDMLVLGPRAAGTGLTLTAATHVIHLSRWWNPAVEEQCNDRTHRIGQKSSVTIHTPMAIHPDLVTQSFDCLLHDLMCRKRGVSESVLSPIDGDANDVSFLQAGLAAEGVTEPKLDMSEAGIRSTLNSGGIDAVIETVGPNTYAIRTSDKRVKPLVIAVTDTAQSIDPNTALALVPNATSAVILGSVGAGSQKTIVPTTHVSTKTLALWPRYVLDI